MTLASIPLRADPLLSSWITAYSSKYARVYYLNNSATGATTGPVDIWSNMQLSQTLPVYSGVQQIDYSGTYIYIHGSGLGNLAWKSNFFCDGHASSLRAQVLVPIQDHREMDQSLERALAALLANPAYPPLFRAAFGSPEISAENSASRWKIIF